MKTILRILPLLLTNSLFGEPNDHFSEALLVKESAEIDFDLVGAGIEPGEVNKGSSSLWYRWKSEHSGRLEVSFDVLEGSRAPYTNLVAYRGESLESLTSFKEVSSSSEDPSLLLRAVPGEVLFFQLASDAPRSGTLSFDYSSKPVNDLRFNPQELVGEAMVEFYPDNSNASEPTNEWIGNFDRGPTTWYRWQAPHDGLLTVFLNKGSLSLHGGDGGPNDEPLLRVSGPPEQLVVSGGQTYLLRYRIASNVANKVFLALEPIVPHTFAASPLELPSVENTLIEGDFTGAIVDESISFDVLSDRPAAVLWYSWTAPRSGLFLIKQTFNNPYFAVWKDHQAGPPTLLFEGNNLWTAFEAKAGESYLFSASARESRASTFQCELSPLDPVTNDDFVDRIDLGPTSNWTVSPTNFLASGEENEPPNAAGVAEASLWYSWTAPTTGEFLIDARKSEPWVEFSVYLGDPFGDHTKIVDRQRQIVFRATRGVTYEISVDQLGSSPSNRGKVVLSLEPAQPPGNDDFPLRTIVTSPRPIFRGNARSATLEPDEPVSSGSLTSISSVWFEWTAPSDQSMYRVVRGLNFFTSNNSNPSLSELERLNWENSWPARVSARSGVTYYIQVSSSYESLLSSFLLDPSNSQLFVTEIAPNDAFDDRIVLPSKTIIRTGFDGAGLEKDDREPQKLRSSYSAWWSWTAPESGYYSIEVTGLGVPSCAVYTGESLESLTEITSGGSLSRFYAEAGTRYQIASAIRSRYSVPLSRSDWVGFELRKINESPVNDDFADAELLDPSLTQRIFRQNYLATPEAGEPSPTASPVSNSVWSKWIPGRRGAVKIESSRPESILGIYTGSSLENLELVASGIGSISFDVQEETTYYLVVDSVEPDAFSLEFSPLIDAGPTKNDDFVDAVVWTGSYHASQVDAATFTFEDLEPYPAGASEASGSSWWKWTAPEPGMTSVQLNNTQLHLSIYRGTNLTDLQVLASTDYLYYPVNFAAEQGITYFIQVLNRSRGSASEFRLILDQKLNSLPNDDFVDAFPIIGSSVTRTVQTNGSSFESGEPQPYGASVWFSWVVPEDGLYRLTTDYGFFRVYVGNELSSLSHRVSGNREVEAPFVAGEEIRIAIISTIDQEIKLELKPIHEVPNDHFEDRIILGSAREVSYRYSLEYSSVESGDPLIELSGEGAGTAWWSWTAPQDGLVAISWGHRVFTGDSLETLVQVGNQSPLRSFIAKQGTIYQIAGYADNPPSQSERELSLSVEAIENDNFADRIVIPSTLPFFWEGTLIGATIEAGEEENNSGSAWWEWSSTFDGEIIFPSGIEGLRIYTGYPSTVALERYIQNDVAPYSVRKGETYYFRQTGFSFTSRVLHLERAPEPTEFSNTSAETAVEITLPVESVQASVGTNGPDQIWYSWLADRDGTLSVLGASNHVGFFKEPDGDHLETLIHHHKDRRSLRVHYGNRYWVRVSANTAREFDFSISLGPPGDMFADAPALPSQNEVSWRGTTIGSGWEFGEPKISGQIPQRTVWRTWIAPSSGKYRYSLDRFHAGIARGDQIESLDFLREGRTGTFEATAGESYRIVVDSVFLKGDFQFTIAPVKEIYEAWRRQYFHESDEAGIASADPDQDGRDNLVEMALGTHPERFDGPINMWMEEVVGDLVLSVLRPMGIEGIAYSFDLAADLNDWEETLDLAHETRSEPAEDGMEIFQVVLKNSPYLEARKAFMRLRVRILSTP